MKLNRRVKNRILKNPDTLDGAGVFVVGNKQQSITTRFGNSVRARRIQLGLTQTALAKIAQLNRSYLSELEHGVVSISLNRAEKLAKALKCKISDLLK